MAKTKYEKPVRKMYCPECQSVESHEVAYHGARDKDGKPHASFDAKCKRCEFRVENGIQAHTPTPRYLIPLADYNALISKQLYA